MEKRAAAPYNACMTAFVKMHGLGNDFVVFDARDSAVNLTPARAKAVADRHFGVGCDTVVVIRPSGAQADASILFYNAMVRKVNPASMRRAASRACCWTSAAWRGSSWTPRAGC